MPPGWLASNYPQKPAHGSPAGLAVCLVGAALGHPRSHPASRAPPSKCQLGSSDHGYTLQNAPVGVAWSPWRASVCSSDGHPGVTVLTRRSPFACRGGSGPHLLLPGCPLGPGPVCTSQLVHHPEIQHVAESLRQASLSPSGVAVPPASRRWTRNGLGDGRVESVHGPAATVSERRWA